MRPLIRARRKAAGGGASRRDPAPSRTAYRLQRIWLTPLFRSLLRTGVPAFSLAIVAGAYLTDREVQQSMVHAVEDMRRSIAERPEFAVRMMAIDGASDELAEDIREILPLDFPASSFDLDLEAMRRVIAGLHAVGRAEVRIRSGGVLQVDVTERIPAIVWRGVDTLELLDDTGLRVASLDARAGRADLPLIVGEGADRAVPEALALFAAAQPLADRLRGLVRVGERRWDVVLDREQRIMLPETGPVEVLEQVIAVDAAKDLLARDIAVVDMRNPARPTVRLPEAAIDELRRIRAIDPGELN